MSIKLQARVRELILPRNERDVLVVLCDYSDSDGRGARPSIRRIAWETDLSDREVIRCLKWLRAPERKIIEITTESGFHKPNVYRIFLDRLPSKPPLVLKGDQLSYHEHEIDSEKGDQERNKGDQNQEKGDQTALKGDTMQSPDPLIEPLVNEPLIEPLPFSTKPSVESIWHSVLGELQLQMTKVVFDTWVRPSRAVSFDEENNIFIVRPHTVYAKEWLEARINTTVKRTISGIVGRPIEVHYVI